MITTKKNLGSDNLVSVSRDGTQLLLTDSTGSFHLIDLVGGGGADFSKLILNSDGSLVYTGDGDVATKV
jgi:hypothetical protein